MFDDEDISEAIERKLKEFDELLEESKKLIEQLEEVNRDKLLEELKCFKDILALQKRLVERTAKQHPARS